MLLRALLVLLSSSTACHALSSASPSSPTTSASESPSFLTSSASSASSVTSLEAKQASNPSSSSSPPLVTPAHLETIARGGVATIPNWLPPTLVTSLRRDAQHLFTEGYFTPDGLTNTARPKSEQGFTSTADRQTFRGGDGWDDVHAGDHTARQEFATRMRQLRRELAVGLNRPTLDEEGIRKHEMTYNWYEPGASLGSHLDEHHEETKGVKGWTMPTRRSVTWLVYLNDHWREEEGGALRCYPRSSPSVGSTVGCHEGNLQVGWLDGTKPVFLDSWRENGLSALYRLEDGKRKLLSRVDFEVPRQPIDFASFLKPDIPRGSFEQISTARLDPRFAASSSGGKTSTPVVDATGAKDGDRYHMDVLPAAGTLVLFDSVSLPHLVREVTAKRQRIAATGWFHEDSQFQAQI